MPYMMETWDKDDAYELRLQLRPKHLEYLDSIAQKLLACGAKISDDESFASGGLYVVAVESRGEAEALINNDPFTQGGLFREIAITKWRKAYFNGVNCL